ncbi:hypothetical protein MAP00_004284 [Monascus purpureus]|nr:hypothetical protein MAP00_004284 [Monascus purpureus]
MILITLLNLINTAAFMAVLSLSAVALYTSYAIPIILLVVKRVYLPAEIRWGPFCLGRWGLPINLFAIVYSVYVVIFVTFPTMLPITASNMNYAAPVLVAVLIFAVLDWVFRGRFTINSSKTLNTRFLSRYQKNTQYRHIHSEPAGSSIPAGADVVTCGVYHGAPSAALSILELISYGRVTLKLDSLDRKEIPN